MNIFPYQAQSEHKYLCQADKMRYRGKLSLSFTLAFEYLGFTVLWEKANQG